MFLDLLSMQKEKLLFYLYIYCLMTNHVHLLIERRLDNIGRIVQLTGFGHSQAMWAIWACSARAAQGDFVPERYQLNQTDLCI